MDMSAYRLRSMPSLSSTRHPHVDLVNDLTKWTGVLPPNVFNNRELTGIAKKQSAADSLFEYNKWQFVWIIV